MQGLTKGRRCNIFDACLKIEGFDIAWIRTAISRVTTLDICFHDNLEDEHIDRYCSRKISGYKAQDIKGGRNLNRLITIDQYVKLIDCKLRHCWSCNCDLPDLDDIELDRIDDSIAHTFDNCRICCKACNRGHANHKQL